MRQGEVATAPAGTIAPSPNGLALASGLDGLSDGSLVQLMNEMNTFDALPHTEPEVVFAVDAATSTEQDSL